MFERKQAQDPSLALWVRKRGVRGSHALFRTVRPKDAPYTSGARYTAATLFPRR